MESNSCIRVYIGGFPLGTTHEQIDTLFSKLCKVQDIYTPCYPTMTGLFRDFAIIQLDNNDELVKKCISAYNGSKWLGKKIRVELAKEFHIQRKMEELKFAEQTEIPVVSTEIENNNPNIFKHNILRIRKSRYTPAIEVSTKPHNHGVEENHKKKRKLNALNSGTHINFEKKLLLKAENDSESDEEGHHEIPSVEDVKKASSFIQPMDKTPTSSKGVNGREVGRGLERGGGVRKGFGTLLIAPHSTAVPCCQDGTMESVVPFDEDLDDEPCLKKEEITDDVLASERLRASRIIEQVLLLDKGQKATVEPSLHVMSEEHEEVLDPQKTADLEALKTIFHREGGVWWGEDGSLKQSVGIGDISSDPLFLEAEKLGMDIRDVKYQGRGGGGTEEDQSSKNQFQFGFFDFQQAVEPSEVVTTEEMGSAVSSMDKQVEEEPRRIEMDEIIQMAKTFCRVKTVDELTINWKGRHDALLLDYKRKRREAKKRSTVSKPMLRKDEHLKDGEKMTPNKKRNFIKEVKN